MVLIAGDTYFNSRNLYFLWEICIILQLNNIFSYRNLLINTTAKLCTISNVVNRKLSFFDGNMNVVFRSEVSQADFWEYIVPIWITVRH